MWSPQWIRRLFFVYLISVFRFGNHEIGTESGFCYGFVLTVKRLTCGSQRWEGGVVVNVGVPFGTISNMRSSWNDNPMEESSMALLTPKQVRAVRKEMLRRRAVQSIDTIYWTEDPILENSSHPSTSVDKRRQIAELLVHRSFVQVRGVVPKDQRDDTRIVKNVAERLALEVQMELRSLLSSSPTTAGDEIVVDPVVHIVEIKGRMVTFFVESATSPVSNPQAVFHLRTTGKQNNWIKRPKALRDSSGQIIK
jgi:hypothetical protein